LSEINTAGDPVVGKGPEARIIRDVFGKDLGLMTHLIAARASLPDGRVRERQLASTALWSRRPEGWRIIYARESSTKQRWVPRRGIRA
jgi:ketosteroid isomerase-like protein